MSQKTTMTVDGNEAAASVAYRTNQVMAIYPITPSSPMGEFTDEWAVQKKPNIWGQIPLIQEMQSEGGAVGAVHGALQAGAMTTTFTASQGLLLMIPNMFKIAGELNAFVMHVAARTVATHALSIFCDHSDVMACRSTGFTMLCSNSVQEAHDFALISQAATLESRVPVMHYFDGFRTSHEVNKIQILSDDDLRHMIDEDLVEAHRLRGLSPDAPKLRGTAQNPDVFFQAREACNPFYNVVPDIMQQQMDKFAARTGRAYKLYEYVGAPDAERVVVLMGSGCQSAEDTVEHLVGQGEKVGMIKVRLYRPFDVERFVATIPDSVKSIAVLDRTKEPGAIGEPMYQDTITALREAGREIPTVIGGRYGLSSKQFTPAMVKGVFDHLNQDKPHNHFTVGIVDDVTHLSIPYDADFDIEDNDSVRAIFFGLGADGTVGANKNSIKIIGENTDRHVQGYFVYDSKKSGARTISHLRFGPKPIRASHLIDRASFVAVHQFSQINQFDVLELADEGATLLLNAPYEADQVWDHLNREAQEQIIAKKLKLFVIDADQVAQDVGMGRRINTIMQACFFKLSNVLPIDEAMDLIKSAIKKTYMRKGEEIVKRNIAAVDESLEHLHEIKVPESVSATETRPPILSTEAPDFMQRVTAVMMAGQGDLLPVSAFTPDGTWPTDSARWERRNIAIEIPIWEPDLCIQCNKCSLVCPHTAIRAAVYEEDQLAGAPGSFQSTNYKAPDFRGLKYTIQVAPEDCTGCNLCVMVCPAKDKSNPSRKAINMAPHIEHVDRERDNYEFFEQIPPVDRTKIQRLDAKGSQFMLPLFGSSGACAGCGETPYVRLITQLFGDRMLIANATGCSSIYGGNLPTTPYLVNPDGRGPSWSNSLFEDNAEFGLGYRLAYDQHREKAAALLQQLAEPIADASLIEQILNDQSHSDADYAAQRDRVDQLRAKLKKIDAPDARALEACADALVRKSVWILGGDGWAYDIGYGGLDHVLASGRDVNVLVLDTEVYSNTGGQASKSTPLGAAAKFAIAGKEINKKDLGLMAMSYGHVYVASVAMGAKDNQVVKAMLEAESYPGPSLIIAYSHCIAHGYDLKNGLAQQSRAVDAGVWPLYRYDPRRVANLETPLQLDATRIKGSVHDYMANEARFRMIEKMNPQRFKKLAAAAADHTARRVNLYQQLSQLQVHETGNGNGNGKDA